MRFAINTQHDTSKVLRLPRKMTMDTDTSKVLRHLPQKLQVILWKRRKSIAPTTFDTLSNKLECDKVPRLPRKQHYNLLGNLQKGEVLQLPP